MPAKVVRISIGKVMRYSWVHGELLKDCKTLINTKVEEDHGVHLKLEVELLMDTGEVVSKPKEMRSKQDKRTAEIFMIRLTYGKGGEDERILYFMDTYLVSIGSEVSQMDEAQCIKFKRMTDKVVFDKKEVQSWSRQSKDYADKSDANRVEFEGRFHVVEDDFFRCGAVMLLWRTLLCQATDGLSIKISL
ncbi:hypothetical protein Tco_0428247 [Tanacetum coccineum]